MRMITELFGFTKVKPQNFKFANPLNLPSHSPWTIGEEL